MNRVGPVPTPEQRVHVWIMPDRMCGITGTVVEATSSHLVLTDVQESASDEVVILLGPGTVIESSSW